jgi:hypothetical protein
MTSPSWPQNLRAAAILFHLATILVLSIPVPPPALRGELPDPRTEAMLVPWGEAAESIGVPRACLFSGIRAFTSIEAAALGVLRAPLRPYARLVGAEQGWLMFGSVSRDPARLEILVKTAEGWSPLLVARSADAGWRRALFDQERMRTFVYNFGARRSKAKWDPFATWVAREVGAERPDASAVRLQMRQLHLPEAADLARTGALEVRGTYWVVEKRLGP